MFRSFFSRWLFPPLALIARSVMALALGIITLASAAVALSVAAFMLPLVLVVSLAGLMFVPMPSLALEG